MSPPSYHGREWCERELKEFIRTVEATDDACFGDMGRLIKVIRLPFLDDSHQDFFRDYQHVDFFRREDGKVRDLKSGSAAFTSAVEKLSDDIVALFDSMQRLLPLVFVASSADDVAGERGFLINQLRAKGYVPWPPPRGKLWGFAEERIHGWLEEAACVVFAIGGQADSALRRQLDLAAGKGKRLIFYMPPGYGPVSEEIERHVREIETEYSRSRKGCYHRLQSASLASMRADLIQCVAPVPDSDEARRDSRMYLLCDVQTSGDVDYARKLREEIQRQENNRILVELPPGPGLVASPGTAHERLLKTSDGLLLFHDQAPNSWCMRNLVDLGYAESLAGHSFKAKAVLVDNPDARHDGLPVIRRRDPVLAQLEPFLASLRGGGSRDFGIAGGAFAG